MTTVSLPAMLSGNPRLSSWVQINGDGTVDVRSGKVELGQGILTALAQIAAEELDVRLGRVRMLATGTDLSPNEGFTAGSLSVQNSGAAVRQACAEVRAIFLHAASAAFGVEPDRLEVLDGEISGVDPTGVLRRTSYWELIHQTSLDRDASGHARPKSPTDYRIVGTSAARLDLPDKLAGRPRLIHDLVLDGMLYGRVVRPPSRGAELIAIGSAEVAAVPGVVEVVRDGNFLGVVAEREEVAIQAAELLRAGAVWSEEPTLPEQAHLNEFLTAAPAETTMLAETTGPAEPPARTLSASFSRPYLAHASIGPSCALALVEGDRLSVWSHSQGVFQLRDELGRALHKPTDQITVQHVEAAGCYGHNGADDAALDAVLLARAVPGRPVQLVWSRQDELGWAPFGPAAVVQVSADVDAAGDVLAWRHEIWGNGHAGRPGLMDSVSLLAAAHTADASPPPVSVDVPLSRGGGAGRNSVPGYAFPSYKVISHRLLRMPLRTSSLRSLGAHLNVFAAESFVDELAEAVGADPVEYRLRHLADARGRAVIEAVARRADWSLRPAGESVGCGIAYARYKNSGAYCAVVAEVEAEHELRVRRLTIAVDAGLVINPDGVINQIEGGAIQATSWTVKEQVSFDRLRVTSDSWETYPILRFTEVPAVDVEVLHRPDEPSLGAGEASQGPTAAAIGNALSAAIGVRVRQLPLTPENIMAAIDE